MANNENNENKTTAKNAVKSSEEDKAAKLLDQIIVLKCMFKGHGGMSITPCRNPKTKTFPKCHRYVDSSNNIIFVEGDTKNPDDYIRSNDRFKITDGIKFDLSKQRDKNIWDCIKYSNLIYDSEDTTDEYGNVIYPAKSRSSSAIFYVERANKEVRNRNKKRELTHKAQNYIFNDTTENIRLVAKVAGKFIRSTTTLDEIQEYLLEKAEIDPQSIIELYTGSDFKLRLLIINAKEKGVIISRSGVMFYNDTNLGRNFDVAIEFLQKNKLILDQLFKDVNPEYFNDK